MINLSTIHVKRHLTSSMQTRINTTVSNGKISSVSIAILCLLFSTVAIHAAAASPSKPNIILVMPDDVGYGDYACLGNPIMRTPSVDAFRKQSLLFTQFHVSPTCSPCRSALMSGRHEFKNGVTHTILERERMSLKTYTLPQMLKSVGYTSGIFGKWHLGDEEPYRPENRGFDEVYIHGCGGIGQTYSGSSGDAPGNSNINPALWHNGKFEKTNGYCTDLFFGQAITWMNAKREAKQPFFAYIPLNAAHAPHVLPKDYYQQYLGKPGIDEDTAKFFGMIENIDTNFGKLLAKLKEWGIEDNTLVIYLGSDNGGTAGVKIFNAGMRDSKCTPYQGGTRTPCFVRWPAGGIPSGAECDALSAHLDLFPTLAEITGATLADEVKQQVEGRSLLSIWNNPKAEWPDRILVHHVGRWPNGKAADAKYDNCAIQNSRFTLVNNSQLFDLKADPGESKNVISEHPEIVATLRATYHQWWNDVQPLLVNENVIGPKVNPMKELYWKQFGGGPQETPLNQIKPGKGRGRAKRSN
jgi:arylsulfatase